MDKMTCQTCGADWLVRARDTDAIEMRECTGCSDGIAFDALEDDLADVGVSEVCRVPESHSLAEHRQMSIIFDQPDAPYSDVVMVDGRVLKGVFSFGVESSATTDSHVTVRLYHDAVEYREGEGE